MATLKLITKPEQVGSSDMRRLTKRERLEKRFQSAKSVRDIYDKDFEEIERLTRAARARSGSSKLKRMGNTAKQDTAGILAGRTLTHGMSTGLSNPAKPWFRLSTGDDDLDQYEPVKLWLYQTEQIIYGHFARTNYYDANKISYAELAHYGHGVQLSIEHREHVAVYHALDHGECWIAEDDGLRVTTLFYKPSYTVDQMVRKFPWNKLSRQVQDAYNRGNIQQLVEVMCVIEKNDDRDASKLDSSNMPYRSTWYEVGNQNKDAILKEGGFSSKPFSSPRWEANAGEVYSSSAPGWLALADLRELEFTARRKGRAMDMAVRPPVFLPAGLQQTAISLDPGSLNFVNEMQGRVEIVKPDPNALSWITDEIQRLTRRVNELFYADLWMAVTDMEGIQPRNQQELMYRNEEKLTQLGPVVDRVNVEKLEVDIDRTYEILDNLGLIPPAPPELQKRPLMINFVSVLAQAQLATNNSSIERAAQFVGYLAGIYPDAPLKFDAMQAIDEFARNSHTNPKIIRSDEMVDAMKAEQAQQEQVQRMAAMAQPAQQGAEAAKLLSETQVGTGGSMLDQMMGV